MPIGRGCRINAPLMGIANHIQKLWIDIRLALKIEGQIKQLVAQFTDDFPKKISFQIACRARERPQPTRAFRATQITSSGRFYRNGERQAPLNGTFEPPRQVKRAVYFCCIPKPTPSELGNKIPNVVPIDQAQGLRSC